MLTPEISRSLGPVPGFAPGDPLRRYLPYAVVLAVVLVILLFGDKYWDANDDIHMAMLTGGYGFAAQPSPGVVYSNVIWGWLAMHLGAPFGIQGYMIMAYAAMLASVAGVGWALLRKQVPGILALTLLLAMFVHALLEPQFSVTAGYAAVAGLALACTLESRRDWPMALAACLLLVAACLIRLQECLFVCLVAAPYLGWRLYRGFGTPAFRPLLALLLAAAALAGAAKLVDNSYYAGPGWQQFREMNSLRRPFTDYSLHGYFEHRPELLSAAGMSTNDMVLMGDWFFLDGKVYNTQSLGGLLQQLPLRERLRFNLQRFRSSTVPFSRSLVYLLAVTALLAMLLARRRWLAIAAVLCLLGCMAAMLLLGRPGVPRIFPGPVAVIAVLASLDHGWHGWSRRLQFLAVIAGLGVLAWVSLNSYHFFRGHTRQARIGARVEHGACAIATQDLAVVWGAPEGFPDRYLYDPASPPGGRCPLHLYHIGVLELLPQNLQQLHAYTGGLDLIPALLAGQRIHFFTTDDRLDELAQYMREHYAAKLTYTELRSQPYLRQYLVQVEASHP